MAKWIRISLALLSAMGLAVAQPAPPVDTAQPAIQVQDAASTGAIVATPSPTPVNPAEAWLRRLETAFQETRTVRGKFEQTLINELFSETIEARGDFYFEKERKFRANHELKEEGKWVKDNELIIADDTLWLYSPVLKQVEIFRFGAGGSGDVGRLHQMFLGFGPKTEEVLKAYDVKVKAEAAREVTLVFRPRDESIAADIDFVEITFDTRDLLPRRVMWLTPSPEENRTTIELKSIDRNARLPAGIFTPKFPEGTERFERN